MFLAAIRGRDVAEAVREMTEAEGKSPNTVRLHLALLSHLFNVARTEWGMEALSNPVELVRKSRVPRGRDRRLVGDEEERLLAACRAMNPELAAIVTIAIETAMRQGEIMGLIWDKIDLSQRCVTLEFTKNGEKRIVPLTPLSLLTVDITIMPSRYNARSRLGPHSVLCRPRARDLVPPRLGPPAS